MSRRPSRDSVLVIDDDPDLLTLIQAIAESCAVRVLVAPNCSKGLKLLESEHRRIKTVFLDYFMPGMDPVKCARAVVAKAEPSIRVVLLTAAADPAARAAELKINYWVAKPFEVSTLTHLLTQPRIS